METSSDSAARELSRSLRRRGALILALFALPWAVVAASGLSPGVAWTVRIAAALVSAGVVLLTYRRGDAGRPERRRDQPEGWHRRVGLVNLAQVVAIFLVVLVLVGSGTPEVVPPVVCLIVGVHFFPLARLFDQPQYTWTAVALCGAAIAGLLVLVGAAPEPSRVVVGFLAAGTLWTTSGRLAVRA